MWTLNVKTKINQQTFILVGLQGLHLRKIGVLPEKIE